MSYYQTIPIALLLIAYVCWAIFCLSEVAVGNMSWAWSLPVAIPLVVILCLGFHETVNLETIEGQSVKTTCTLTRE